MPLLGNKNVALQRHRRGNSMCEYSNPPTQTGGTAARRDPLKQYSKRTEEGYVQ